MKSLYLTLSFIAIALMATSQFPQLKWAKSMGGPLFDGGYAMAVDASGNVYTTGPFYGTVDFDPGAGVFNLTSNGQNDVYISKLDASGNFLWAKSFGGTTYDAGRAIVVDASGNIYATGQFGGTVDFDPGASVFNLTSAGANDIFILKLDASGSFVFAKQMGGTLEDIPWAMTLDASGNIYTTGYFQGTSDFDPGTGTSNLISNGGYDIFISKLNASGNFTWAKGVGGSSSFFDSGHSIKVDALGNVYTSGDFNGTVDFDPGAGIFNLTPSAGSNNDMYVLKLNASGNFIWAKQMKGTNSVNNKSLALDASCNVYTTGQFQDLVDFDPGTATANLTSAGNNDIFISKLDSAGNFKWVKQIGGSNIDAGFSLVLDASNNIFLTGWFQGTVDFDPNAGVLNLTSNAGLSETFISKFDASGNVIWAKTMGFAGGASYIMVDAAGNFYLTGSYSGTIDCDPNSGVVNLTSVGSTDIFILKLSQTAAGISKNLNQIKLAFFPNPTNGILFFDLGKSNKEDLQFQILNSIGQVIGEEKPIRNSQINLQNFASGIYFIRVISDNSIIATQKIIKQ